MALSDRLFAPPAVDAARIERRQAQLPARLRDLLRRAGDALEEGDAAAAQSTLTAALTLAPQQPDVLRLYAWLLAQAGRYQEAFTNFEAALRAAPDDAFTYWQYARTLEEAGAIDTALQLRQRAVQHLPDSPLAWADLGEHLYMWRSVDASLAPLERAAQLAPDYAPGLFKLGNAYVACGRSRDGAAMVRRALACEPAFGAAWLGLVDIKTEPVTEPEMVRMRELLADSSRIDSDERTAIEFALAMVCERTGNYREAWQRLVHANARRKQELRPWSPEAFQALEQATREAFERPHTAAATAALGEQVIFIVGMPRSGTTLVEQILAAHPQVHGAGELGAMPQVLAEASARRQRRYPEWVASARAEDWERLGHRYLELTAEHRRDRAFSTDKLPNNWRALGAIRAMLPGARIIVCRRDPLENCWSCFKQYFSRGWEFTYAIDQLATFWKGFDRAASDWARRDPGSVREQHYEALTESSEAEIRALLSFCGLPWDAACLRFHESDRGVQTLSAAQVRQPMHKSRRIAASYGALLDPLRSALGLPPSTSSRS